MQWELMPEDDLNVILREEENAVITVLAAQALCSLPPTLVPAPSQAVQTARSFGSSSACPAAVLSPCLMVSA